MTRVLIRAELPVAGLRVGHEPVWVESTPLIQTLTLDGKLTVLDVEDDSEPEDQAAATESEPPRPRPHRRR